jgi:hypothetical protein
MSTVNDSSAFDVGDDDLLDSDLDGDLLALGLDSDDDLDGLMEASSGLREPGWRRLERVRENKILRLNLQDFEDYEDFDQMSDEYFSDFDH